VTCRSSRLRGSALRPRMVVARASALAEQLGFDLREAAFYSDSFTDLLLLAHVAEAAS